MNFIKVLNGLINGGQILPKSVIKSQMTIILTNFPSNPFPNNYLACFFFVLYFYSMFTTGSLDMIATSEK